MAVWFLLRRHASLRLTNTTTVRPAVVAVLDILSMSIARDKLLSQTHKFIGMACYVKVNDTVTVQFHNWYTPGIAGDNSCSHSLTAPRKINSPTAPPTAFRAMPIHTLTVCINV